MIKTTNIPNKENVSNHFEITLNGNKAEAFYSRVSAIPFNRDWPGKQRPIEQTELASVLSFSSDEAVQVCLKPNKPFQKVAIRPLSKHIVPHISEGVIEFTIPCQGQYVVELDGPSEALHIFVDPIVEYNISADDDGLLYYGPGIHHIGQVELLDNTTVYIDRDALVYGAFYAVDAQNIRILGNGVLDGDWEERENRNYIFPYDFSRVPERMWGSKNACHVFSVKPDPSILPERNGEYIPGTGTELFVNKEQFKKYLERMSILKSGLHFYKCKNVEVNGIIVNGASGLSNTIVASENVVYDNVKVIGMWKHNNDGIDFYNCQNCTVKKSFVRAFDDVICMKGQTGWDTQNVENMLVENCIVWCDWARTLEVGIDTVASEMRNITFRNCDCLHHSMTVLDVGTTDRAKVQNVLFEDICVEYSVYDAESIYQKSDDETFVWKRHIATLFDCYIGGPNTWSNDGIRGSITGVTLRNIKVFTEDDMSFPKMKIRGKDTEHMCKDIIIDGVYYNGKRMTTETELSLQRNEYTENVVIIE